MQILTIDCGTKSGWACNANGRIESGVQSFELKRGKSKGMRFIRFNAWLHEILELTKPELVIYEMAHHRGGAATEVLIGMVTRIEEECEKQGIDYTSIHSLTLKKFVTGSGKIKKEKMLEEAKEKFGPHIQDDNEADALWMLHWAKEEYETS